MNLSDIRKQIDSVPLLSYNDFPGLETSERVVDYLHYLCVLGRFIPIRDYLETIKEKYGDIKWLLNDNSIYKHWYQTPLATLASWNNNPVLASYLVNQGADPNISNYYDNRPGGEMMDTIYVPQFNLGIPLDDIAYGSRSCRSPACFNEINNYLSQVKTKLP